ncbi:RteC domain-containing protein [Pedobacter flavus]|uniref:RteC domain-containing protein n=1 Tax=Pedobacter flavus TaxID=3113906 RepID=A0ABU7H219_9SPHI|nr:RteC domain-containing protein [Pedobacter sp. VNH31]MEE1885352.1 RteC domain-containing protein [Pedobacter sp. VNH31]
MKPQFIAKLIYYNAVYKLESKNPNESKSAKKYINNELKKLKKLFDNNLEFYKYYRTNNTFIDDQLFVRGKNDIILNLDTFYFETDHSFSTIGDYKSGKILANDLIPMIRLFSYFHASSSIVIIFIALLLNVYNAKFPKVVVFVCQPSPIGLVVF